MHLPILAAAFGIYVLGIALVLYFRPRVMFREGGTWKEFGIGRTETHSIFPFWLFAIFWAFMSYGIGLVIMSQLAVIAMSPDPGAPSMQQVAVPVSSVPVSQPQVQPQMQSQVQPQMTMNSNVSQAPVFMKPVSSLMGLPQNSGPGYYVLQNVVSGQPQYVYYGTEPPKV